MPTRCPQIPQKDQQDPLYRPAGDADESPQLPATQASSGSRPVAERDAGTLGGRVTASVRATDCWLPFVFIMTPFCLCTESLKH